MKPALRSKAKSRILRWFDVLSPPANARATLSRSIDLMFDELGQRESWREVMTVALGDSAGLPLIIRSRNWRTIACADMLAVCTVVPGWTPGWSKVIRDDDARDTLTEFLHYARQYIHRSQVAKVLMITWEAERRVLHPFGLEMVRQIYGPMVPSPSLANMLCVAQAKAYAKWGEASEPKSTRSPWVLRNTLDPYIHQAIFHFLRGQNLLAHEFEMEAVVAFDCVLQSLKGLLIRGKLATSATGRGEICRMLGIGSRPAAIADEGYFLRNNFGAHAGGWRWWDQDELTEEVAPSLGRLAERALGKAAAMESGMREIEVDPSDWSEWLLTNFDALWDVVWFAGRRGV
jgi:hypothetical protein